MGQTISEKIFSRHSRKNVKSGDIVIADVDFSFSQDGTSLLVIEKFNSLGKESPAKNRAFAMVIDHSSPSPNQKISEIHNVMRNFCDGKRIRLYNIGEGICHQVIPESGFVMPGGLVCGADSHTCTYGALNAFASGMGSTDIAIILAYGKNWFLVPESIKFIVEGNLSFGCFAKDVILYIIGKVKADYANYRAVEYTGNVISGLSMDGRFTIANMSVEIGAKAGIMLFDKKTENWLKDKTKKKLNPVLPDKDAKYLEVKEFDISKIEPQVACPHSVDNVKPISVVKGTVINQAFLGTCTNGRLEDLEISAKILRNKKIHPEVRFIVAPASKRVFLEALNKGIIEVFIKAGAVVISPGCGPCVGTHAGVPADNEVIISTANRNFKGRMGNPNAEIYLASPATVTASAIEGKITDPRKYL
ncbi:MAG: 3-isopropylmalate dehydratase large subunit [Candidatus Omnitrophica bacterium]|nr:3-isopropylmalate dehydratase large subunit [Candidatus Omnitrophota bacterium]